MFRQSDRTALRAVLIVALLCCAGSAAQAAIVYGLDAPLAGTRTVGATGLTTSDSSDWGDAVINWNIVYNSGDQTFTYTYDFINFDRPGISNIVIDLTDGIIITAETISGAQLNGNSIPTADIEFGNFYGLIGAVKFDVGDDGDLTYTFTSNRRPVWGDVYVKGGQEYLRNTGFTDHSLADPGHFIARPDGAVPEPALLLPLGALITLVRRRRR